MQNLYKLKAAKVYRDCCVETSNIEKLEEDSHCVLAGFRISLGLWIACLVLVVPCWCMGA